MPASLCVASLCAGPSNGCNLFTILIKFMSPFNCTRSEINFLTARADRKLGRRGSAKPAPASQPVVEMNFIISAVGINREPHARELQRVCCAGELANERYAGLKIHLHFCFAFAAASKGG